MVQNSWCRVCLAGLEVDVKMYSIKNTHLLEIFEKLSSTKLNAEDGRPHTICYICFSQLQRCCRFSDMCHKSEKYQKEHLLHGTVAEGVIPPAGITHNLSVTALPLMKITDYSNQGNIIFNLKEEFPHNEEDIEVKEEPIDIKKSSLLEDAVADDNTIGLEQPLVKVKRNNVCALPYCCDVCSKEFVSKQRISRHMAIHVNAKRYACNMCNKTFIRKNHFQNHMTSHTREKPNVHNVHMCLSNMCNEIFEQKGDLRRHMKIHTRKRPHACFMCNKTFIERDNLQQHMRTHASPIHHQPLCRDI